MSRLIRDGKVAVLVSRGYGAGWSTWNSGLGDAAVFCPEMAADILAGRSAEKTAMRLFPGAYHGGVADLQVEWVPVGTRFEIDEYDGNESLRILSPADGYVA